MRAAAGQPLTDWQPASRPRRNKSFIWVLLAILTVALLAPLVAIGWYQYEHVNRIYEGVSALGIDLGGMTSEEAERALARRASELTARSTVVRGPEREWPTNWAEIGLRLPPGPIVERAMTVGREGNPLGQLSAQVRALRQGIRIPAEQSFDQRVLTDFVWSRVGHIDRPVRDARLELKPDLTVELTTAQTGRRVDVEESIRRIYQAAELGAQVIDLAVTTTEPVTTDAMRLPAKEKAERILAAPLTLAYADQRWTMERQELADLIVFAGGPGVPLEVRLSDEKLLARVNAVGAEILQRPQDARFDWNGGNPQVIQPSGPGRELDAVSAARLVSEAAEGRERTVGLPVRVTQPAVDAAQLNRMGFRELIEGATTPFVGSVPQKAHNIKLAASRLHGIAIPPNALFSFNEALGPTTVENGYQIAFGITASGEQHKTVPSVAGGICQVATTLFQPVFWSGYQIEERNWHLYWIPAYTSKGVVGLDATVDEETALDLKFFNNSDTYLLIQSRADDTSVTFELYGTKPAWEVKVDGPAISDQKPPDPTPVTEPEPSLPAGQRIQVEAAREGFTARFVRTVTQNGNVRTLNLESRYVPSRNVTLLGTGGRPDPRGTTDLNRPTTTTGPRGRS